MRRILIIGALALAVVTVPVQAQSKLDQRDVNAALATEAIAVRDRLAQLEQRNRELTKLVLAMADDVAERNKDVVELKHFVDFLIQENRNHREWRKIDVAAHDAIDRALEALRADKCRATASTLRLNP